MGIDPGVSHLGGEIVSHNTTEARQARILQGLLSTCERPFGFGPQASCFQQLLSPGHLGCQGGNPHYACSCLSTLASCCHRVSFMIAIYHHFQCIAFPSAILLTKFVPRYVPTRSLRPFSSLLIRMCSFTTICNGKVQIVLIRCHWHSE